MPKDRDKQSKQRKLLGHRRHLRSGAVKVVNGAKVILLGLFLAAAYGATVALDTDMTMTMLLVSRSADCSDISGRRIWLKIKIKGNQTALTYGLPDALDLMVVCVESGLTVDGAMQRVGSGIGPGAPGPEPRVGDRAHGNARRVCRARGDAESRQSHRMSPGLIQLSVDAHPGRSIRHEHRPGPARAGRHAAKPASGRRRRNAPPKASVKMSFPLVLFIFPATFIVLAGPTVIGLLNSPLFK